LNRCDVLCVYVKCVFFPAGKQHQADL